MIKFLFLMLCCCFNGWSQINKGILKPFIAPEAIFIFDLREDFVDSETQAITEISDDRITGFGLNAGLYLTKHIVLEGYFGKEFLLDRNIDYQVYALGINGVLNDKPNTWAGSLKVGGHIGDFTENGFLLRAGLGFKFNIIKKINLQTEVLYSYQSIFNEKVIVNNMDSRSLTVEGFGIRLIFYYL